MIIGDPMRDKGDILDGESAKKLYEALWKDEIRIFKNDFQNDRTRIFILLAWASGARIGELLWMKRRDVIKNMSAIYIKREKKRREVRDFVKVDRKVIEEVLRYCDRYNIKEDDFLFQTTRKRKLPISREKMFEYVRAYCKKLGIKTVSGRDVHPHTFRHSWAVYFLLSHQNDPLALLKVREQLGHSFLETTTYYVKSLFGKVEPLNLEKFFSSSTLEKPESLPGESIDTKGNRSRNEDRKGAHQQING